MIFHAKRNEFNPLFRMEDNEGAANAQQKADGTIMNGKKITVAFAEGERKSEFQYDSYFMSKDMPVKI